MPSAATSGASYGYSMDAGKGISVMVSADGRQAESGLRHTQKALTRTAETAKKTGNEGQKAMDKWGKALERAGSASYDFGNQTFQSMTIADAVKEYVVGAAEMGLMGAFGGEDDWEEYWTTVVAGPIAGALVYIGNEIIKTDWGGIGDYIGEALGTHTHEKVLKELEITFTEAEYDRFIKAAVARGDWESVSTFIDDKLAEHKFTNVDIAIKDAIGRGRYDEAAALIDSQLGNHNWTLVNDGIVRGVRSGLPKLSEEIDKWYSGYTPSGIAAEGLTRAVGRATALAVVQGVKDADWSSADDSINTAMEKWGTKFAEILQRHVADIAGGLDITVAETIPPG